MDKNYIENVPMKAPGLTIKAGGSTIVKAANAFIFKAMGIMGGYGANTDMAGLEDALGVDGAATGDLIDGYTRIYTFLASVTVLGVTELSVVHGDDFLTSSRAPKTSDINLGNAVTDPETNETTQDSKKAIIGFLLVQADGADFVPGTTALDSGDVDVSYIDNYGFVGL